MKIFIPESEPSEPRPLFGTLVEAGFPSPADDYIEQKLDLNKLIINHPAATFFLRVEGNSMENANIYPGDILVVDRSLTPRNSQIIVAVVNGEFTVKRIKKEKNTLYLVPENCRFKPLKITPGVDFQVWGVVTYIVHKAK